MFGYENNFPQIRHMHIVMKQKGLGCIKMTIFPFSYPFCCGLYIQHGAWIIYSFWKYEVKIQLK